MADPINIDFDALLENPFGIALAAGRLKATITKGNEHLTVSFKCWTRGDRRRNVPIYEAERVYIEVPNKGVYGDRIGNIDVASGTFYEEPSADPERVTLAKQILRAAQGDRIAEKVQHPGVCMICGRELTDPVSIERGIGPDCFGNATGSQHQEKVKRNRTGRPSTETVEDTEPHIHVSNDDRHFRIDFQSKFSRELLNGLKAATTWKNRSYDSYTKSWYVEQNAQNAQALTILAKECGLKVSVPAREQMRKYIKAAADEPVKPDLTIGYETTVDDDKERSYITVKFDGPNFNTIKDEIKGIETSRKWSPTTKQWEIEPTKQAALTLHNLCKEFTFEISDEAVELLKPLRMAAERDAKTADTRIALSKADDADVDLDGFGYDPYPFQRAGIMYGEYSDDRYMIADEQGLGKTIQALGRIHVKRDFPAVVVTPSNVKIKWGRAVQHAMPDVRVEVLEGEKPRKLEAEGVYVVNWDILSHWVGALISIEPKALVLDESHYIKTPEAQRTIATHALSEAIPADGMVVELTGTPVLNRPLELVEQLKAIGRLDDFGGFGGFVTKYVGWEDNPNPRKTGKIPLKNGAKNLPELNEKLRSLCYVRRLKKDVLPELPEKQRDVVPMALDTDDYKKAYDEARARVKSGESSGYAAHLAEINFLRKAAAKGKMKAVIQWIEDVLATGEKLVVFAHHRPIQKALHEAFPGSVRIAGRQDQTKKRRQAAMDAFQEDPDTKLAVCSLESAREGIDLFAASNLAFVELGWNPGVHNQAEDRIHRIGQDRGTMMSYLLAENSIDEEMAELIEKKRKVVDASTEGQEYLDEPDEEMVGNLIKWLVKEEDDDGDE